jgi:hypothetical protein
MSSSRLGETARSPVLQLGLSLRGSRAKLGSSMRNRKDRAIEGAKAPLPPLQALIGSLKASKGPGAETKCKTRWTKSTMTFLRDLSRR